MITWLRAFEKNWHWGKLTISENGETRTCMLRGRNGTQVPKADQHFDWDGWSLRIGWHQVALWHSDPQPVFQWLPWWSGFRKKGK